MITFKYIFVVIILFIIITLFYFFLKPKKINLDNEFNSYVLHHSNTPVAFTYMKTSDKYINYYFDTATGNLVQKLEDFPVKLDGIKYEDIVHGDIIEDSTGFKIIGIDNNTFLCPNNWYWNDIKKSCTVAPLCNPEDVGNIKGISQYQFQYLQLNSSKTVHYHDRLYAVCLNKNGDYELYSCKDNKIYNQLETQLNSSEPCKFYDICSENQNNYTHRMQISDYVLKENEYWVCINGASVLYSCEPPLVYNTALNLCTENSICWGKDENSTIYIDENSYYLCQNQKEYKIICSLGIFEKVGSDGDVILECKNENCNKEIYTKFFNNEYFNIPLSAIVCENNTPIEKSCNLNPNNVIVPLKQSSIYINPKRNFFDSDIIYNTEMIEYQDDTFSTISCKILNNETATNYLIKGNINISYNYALQSEPYNIEKNELFYLSEYNYVNYFGNVIKVKDNSIIGSTKDYLPFMGSKYLYKILNEVLELRMVDEFYGFTINYITKKNLDVTPIAEVVPTKDRLASFAHMLFPCGNKTYRMLLYNQIDRNWNLFDFDESLLIESYNLSLNTSIVDDSSLTIQSGEYSPPTPKNIKFYTQNTFSSDPENPYLYYNLTATTWEKHFINFEINLILPQFVLSLQNFQSEDIDFSFKTKFVGAIQDNVLLEVDEFVNSINVISDDFPRRDDSIISNENYYDATISEILINLLNDANQFVELVL